MHVSDFVRDIKWRCAINCVCFRSYPTEYISAGNSWGEPKCRRERGSEVRQLRPASENTARGPPQDTTWRKSRRRRTSGHQALPAWCPSPTASSCLCSTVASYRLVSFSLLFIKQKGLLLFRVTINKNTTINYIKMDIFDFRILS